MTKNKTNPPTRKVGPAKGGRIINRASFSFDFDNNVDMFVQLVSIQLKTDLFKKTQRLK